MKLRNLLLLAILAAFAGCQNDPEEGMTSPQPQDPFEQNGMVRGELQVKLDRETADAMNVTRTRSGELTTGNLSFDEICSRFKVTGMERMFPDDGYPNRTRESGLDRWYIVRFEGDDEQIAEAFRRQEGVEYAVNPFRIKRIGRTVSKGAAAPAVPETRAVPRDYPFNDPLFSEQWDLYNDGSINSSAKKGADINVLPAWEKTTGRNEVLVAVVDEGVQYNHPDLAANMWEGKGKNFCSADNDDITWGIGHGTHVAGTIAAVSNNGIGISGIAGGDGSGNGVKIISCEIFHPTNEAYNANSLNTGQAIKYAADRGAVICQNSWGYDAGAYNTTTQWAGADQPVKDAIDYFIKYAGMDDKGRQTGPMKGGVCIFAAGNESSGLKGYPGAYDECISVSALACNYEAAFYTNYGPTVDIAAPGGGGWASLRNPQTLAYTAGYILSTIPTDLHNGQRYTSIDSNGKPETVTIDYVSTTPGYGYMNGTSMACPHVSGVAALIVSRFGKTGFTKEDLKKIMLTDTGIDIDQYQGNVYDGSGTYVGKLGKLVDAGACVSHTGYSPVPGGDNPNPGPGPDDPSPVPGVDAIAASFYPNPCTDVLNIKIDQTGKGVVRLRNNAGNETINRVVSFTENTPYQLNVSDLASGSYLVDVTFGGAKATQTVIKK